SPTSTSHVVSASLFQLRSSKIMSKVLSVLLIVFATSGIAFSQKASPNSDNPTSQGIAPKVINGIGRADVRVFDENGNPIRNAYVKLESTRSDGFFCESWGDTDERGIIALLPIHMGSLKLKEIGRASCRERVEVSVVGVSL